jgi:hypothetical protein
LLLKKPISEVVLRRKSNYQAEKGAKDISSVVSGLIYTIREIVALWHYLSDIMALLEILQLISAHGTFEGLALWMGSAIASALIAEVFQSLIPTPLRILFRALGSGD